MRNARSECATVLAMYASTPPWSSSSESSEAVKTMTGTLIPSDRSRRQMVGPRIRRRGHVQHDSVELCHAFDRQATKALVDHGHAEAVALQCQDEGGSQRSVFLHNEHLRWSHGGIVRDESLRPTEGNGARAIDPGPRLLLAALLGPVRNTRIPLCFAAISFCSRRSGRATSASSASAICTSRSPRPDRRGPIYEHLPRRSWTGPDRRNVADLHRHRSVRSSGEHGANRADHQASTFEPSERCRRHLEALHDAHDGDQVTAPCPGERTAVRSRVLARDGVSVRTPRRLTRRVPDRILHDRRYDSHQPSRRRRHIAPPHPHNVEQNVLDDALSPEQGRASASSRGRQSGRAPLREAGDLQRHQLLVHRRGGHAQELSHCSLGDRLQLGLQAEQETETLSLTP